MRLEEITLDHVNRAIDLYLEHAYRDAPIPPSLRRPAGSGDTPVSQRLREDFLDETARLGRGARAYALRLGNRRYAFMKMRLLEHLFHGEFYFTVDTHDQMFQAERDFELARLMEFNRELRASIEAAWEGAGLPTTVNLKGVLECRPLEREPPKGARILLVDDDAAILDTVAHLLELKGYEVDLARDGEEALSAARPERHDLILMDVEMPRMDGIEACALLKADGSRRGMPVLLASARAFDMARPPGDGFLVKPFQADVLLRFLEAMLRDASRGERTNASA
ncbi:MAG: response regulator [Planctomycetes bacterium]|nr:response regulator [Planctomycetota bacterium]